MLHVEPEQRLHQEIQLSAGSLAEAGEMCGIEDSGKRENNLSAEAQRPTSLLKCLHFEGAGFQVRDWREPTAT